MSETARVLVYEGPKRKDRPRWRVRIETNAYVQCNFATRNEAIVEAKKAAAELGGIPVEVEE